MCQKKLRAGRNRGRDTENIDHGRHADEATHPDRAGQISGGQPADQNDPERHFHVGHGEVDHGRQMEAAQEVDDLLRRP